MYHMCKCLVIDVDTFIKLVGLGCFQFNYDKIFICFSLTYVIYSASMTTVSSTQQTPFVITRPIITDVNKQKTTVKIEVALRGFLFSLATLVIYNNFLKLATFQLEVEQSIVF